jgi:uncharacterized protein (TIGR02118 family)
MVEVMLLVRRKEGMSRDAFREYYENKHAVLAARTMASCTRYVRNFVHEEPSGPQDFDVITEFWFDVDGGFEAVTGLADAATQRVLAEDEAQFMDRGSMRVITVVEHETASAQLSGNSAR